LVFLSKEQTLVQQIALWTKSAYIGDDCAVLPGQTVISTDALVEGTHFSMDFTDWYTLGYKSCAVNISDVAAMAASPRYLTVALVLPQAIAEESLRQFYAGFMACSSLYEAQVVGGDLTRGAQIVISVTVLGEAGEYGPMLRRGAQVGDCVVVSGNFGASALGLELLLRARGDLPSGSSITDYSITGSSLSPFSISSLASSIGDPACAIATAALLERHLKPEPRVNEALALVAACKGRGSLMDASDGLADALSQIAQASGVGMEIDLASIPLAPELSAVAARLGLDPYALAFFGGEDYELVATMPEAIFKEHKAELPFVKIGTVVAARAALVKLNFAGGPLPTQFRGLVSDGDLLDLSNCFKHFC
jgi:thiamine-monophosphate kinase